MISTRSSSRRSGTSSSATVESSTPGHGHARAARNASGVAHRRTVGDGSGPRRDPAQRRRQGEPVFPARLQSRSRHGPRHQRRRHSRQHAHAWPRPGLHRHQLRDSRNCWIASSTRRARITPTKEIFPRPAPSISSIAAASTTRCCRSPWARTRLHAACSPDPPARRTVTCSGAWTTASPTARGIFPKTCAA